MYKRIFASLSLAIVGGFVAIGAYKFFETPQKAQVVATQPTYNASYSAGPANATINFVDVAQLSTPMVVHIKTSSTVSTSLSDPFKEFFGYGERIIEIPQMGAGSGVIISSDGFIVTNNHVIKEADEIEVVLNDKRSYKAKIIGTDPSSDLALIKIQEKDLPSMRLGNSDETKVGEWVLAVGNPFNLTSTVTAGIISAKARNINLLGGGSSIESFLQTDAAVNPGNSGGALVNLNGELIGINTAIASRTGSFAGYSFAIPANIVAKVTNDLKEYGVVQRGFIGVNIQDVTADLAKEENLDLINGAFVRGLTSGGAAAEAGIKPGDVITKVNGIAVKSTPELQEQVGNYRPGDIVAVTVIRNKTEKILNVTLRNREGTTSLVEKKESRVFASLGASFENLNDKEMSTYGVIGGVKIKSLNSGGKLSQIGIREGFVITKVGNETVSSVEELENVLALGSGSMLLEGFYPGSSTRYKFGLTL
ncbi:MAG: serine protease Do [Sphingobacteriales bacterium]|jgi:serine protease Do